MNILQRNMDREAKEGHLEILARECDFDWKSLRPHLGLTLGQEDDISRSVRDYGEQRRAFLYKWKQVMGSSATYRALIEAANKVGNRRLGENVMEVMNTAPSTTNNDSGSSQRSRPQGMTYELLIHVECHTLPDNSSQREETASLCLDLHTHSKLSVETCWWNILMHNPLNWLF